MQWDYMLLLMAVKWGTWVFYAVGAVLLAATGNAHKLKELQTIFRNVASVRDTVTGAYIQGINMEGPYIAMSKKGAQNGAYVRNPDAEEFKRLFEDCGGAIKVVDIAPETDGA